MCTDHTINRSFHRSMQSAAFLPMFLMFIAISSRMRVLCLELQNVLQQAVSNAVGLLPTVMVRCDSQIIIKSLILAILAYCSYHAWTNRRDGSPFGIESVVDI